MPRQKKKTRIKVRLPVPQKSGKTILTDKDKAEIEESKKTSSQYIDEYLNEEDDEED